MTFQSGSTILVPDKGENRATMQRKFLFWRLKPREAVLADIKQVTVNKLVDRASGVEVCNTMLVLNTGKAWALPASDVNDAETTALAMRNFLGLR